ncbi:YqcC family protein [Vibrio maerlii]|uniref:YqcC family protein n=1 Tax=Vibrio maerlii TaxID=2231648 RepID=UPI000E3C57F3|nr:YqcC family protein [Vibrio maerlii]
MNHPISILLDELEAALRAQGAWQDAAPSEQDLRSQQPFAVDTLAPEQWLQWIFIPKIKYLIATNTTLPSGFEMKPYFEQVWNQQPGMQSVIDIVGRIDRECT